MRGAKMGQKVVSKTGKSVFMGDDKRIDLIRNNCINGNYSPLCKIVKVCYL
jgi:hypothetical protein